MTSVIFWNRNPAEVCKMKQRRKEQEAGRANLSREGSHDKKDKWYGDKPSENTQGAKTLARQLSPIYKTITVLNRPLYMWNFCCQILD